MLVILLSFVKVYFIVYFIFLDFIKVTLNLSPTRIVNLATKQLQHTGEIKRLL